MSVSVGLRCMRPRASPAPPKFDVRDLRFRLKPATRNSKAILVTGAAGFLGSHLCDALLADGHHVIAVDNLLTGREANLAHLKNEPRFEFHQHDICRPFDFGKVDYVLDFASPASPVEYMQHGIETLQVGSYGVFNCIALAKK